MVFVAPNWFTGALIWGGNLYIAFHNRNRHKPCWSIGGEVQHYRGWRGADFLVHFWQWFRMV